MSTQEGIGKWSGSTPILLLPVRLETRFHESELWVRIFKSDTDVPSVTWNDCIVESIRVGWIDGQMKPFDDMSYLQRLTRRKVNSNWSAKNCRHATTLIAEGRMRPD